MNEQTNQFSSIRIKPHTIATEPSAIGTLFNTYRKTVFSYFLFIFRFSPNGFSCIVSFFFFFSRFIESCWLPSIHLLSLPFSVVYWFPFDRQYILLFATFYTFPFRCRTRNISLWSYGKAVMAFFGSAFAQNTEQHRNWVEITYL